MITATIVNDAAFKASAITPLWRTLQSDTSLVGFNIRVTPGSVLPRAGLPIRLYYTTSSFVLDPANAPAHLARQAVAFEIPLPWRPGVPACHQVPASLVMGQNLYVWTDTPNLDSAVSLEIDVVEV